QQVDEALTYLVNMIISVGISQDFRQRLEPRMPLQATPFMALRRELEKYLMASPEDESALRSVRMLIAVCQAQTDRIYSHLDEYGVSVGLVYRVERMRAQLARMTRLIDLRSMPPSAQTTAQVQALLIDLIDAHHHRSSVKGLISRSFSLLARKMVERNADFGEQYAARDRGEYGAMLKSAWRGGAVASAAVLAGGALTGGGTRFFEGMLASLNYAACFGAIALTGGTLAARQPALTAPALASHMHSLDTLEGLRRLMSEVAALARAQAAAVFGNVMSIIPVMMLLSSLMWLASGAPLLPPGKAHADLASLSALGPTPLLAAVTGVLLWLSGLAAGFADNWFALRQLRDGLAHHRRLVHVLGAARAQRWAGWFERHVSGIAGNLSLAFLLGMTPVLARFFGVPFDIRHVTLATGELAASAGSLGIDVLKSREFWLAAGGVALTGLLNVGVAFTCALTLALRAREVPGRTRRRIFRSLVRRAIVAPHVFLFPPKQGATITSLPTPPAAVPRRPARRSRSGGRRSG
ncbi:MAG TPA: preprotein translocase subunit TatB, partial [Noviherbaspirillum sp.]|nr:preprotein translocase subunit TatB [Noviherbaspirillum sp.]